MVNFKVRVRMVNAMVGNGVNVMFFRFQVVSFHLNQELVSACFTQRRYATWIHFEIMRLREGMAVTVLC